MGIRIDGTSDLINATDGSLTIEGQSINTTGIVTAGAVTVSGDITANGNIVGDNSTDISGINDVTISMLSISDTITHTGDTDTKIRFPSSDTFTVETASQERFLIRADGRVSIASSLNVTGVCTATAFIPSVGQLSRKNMIINGDCRVAQRGASVTTGTGNFGAYTLDQWKISSYATDQLNLTVTQEAMNQAVPGLANFIKVSPNAAETALASDEYTHLRQTIEAKDCQRLKWGTASAESATLSFWVKSNTTGTAGITFNKHDATSYYITRTYTINAADTWEYKTVTIPGLTASGIANDTGIGINIYWFLSAGSDYTSTDSTSWVTAADSKYAYGHGINLTDSTSDYLALAGVQFEVGTVDTPFEHLSYSEELALCQRYYQQWKRGYLASNAVGTSDLNIGVPLTVPLRAAPSIDGLDMHRSGNKTATVSIVSVEYSDVNSIVLEVRVGGWTGGNAVVDETAYVVIPSGDTMKISAEL